MPAARYKQTKYNLDFTEYHPPLHISFWGTDEFLKTYKRLTGTDPGFLHVVQNSKLRGYTEDGATDRIAKSMDRRLTKSWVVKEVRNFDAHVSRLKKIVKKNQHANLTKRQLVRLFESLVAELGKIYPYSNAFYLLSIEIERRVLAELQKLYSTSEASRIVVQYSSPLRPTFLKKYAFDVAKIARGVRKKYGLVTPRQLKKIYCSDKVLKRSLDRLREKYFCLTSINDRERTVESFFPEVVLGHSERNTVPQVHLSGEVEKLLFTLRAVTYFKDEISTFLIPYVYFGLQKQWSAAALALKVGGKDLEQLTVYELIDNLKYRRNVSKLLKKRKKTAFFYHVSFKSTVVFDGDSAQKEIAAIKVESSADLTSVRNIVGTIGSSGKVVGEVQKVLSTESLSSFQKGRVLVAVYTAPDYAPAMKKAIAIVTDTGGITCHAAIVARELGLPCVVGTKIATEILKDGDRVEVDANKGMVRKINK